MCGRCSGFRGAITLSRRSPNAETVEVSGGPSPWDTALIVFGLLGLAAGAFHWTTIAKYVAVRQWLAERLVDRDITWPLRTDFAVVRADGLSRLLRQQMNCAAHFAR